MLARQHTLGLTGKSLTLSLVAATFSLAIGCSVLAQTPSASAKPAAQQVKTADVTGGPSWAELTPAQKTALAPLATTWSSTAEPQKRKWLEISKNYPRLTPAEQATMNGRMTEWVAMSPQQRAQARLNFAKTKELSTDLTPDEKKAKWETYQALTPEQKKDLAAAAVQKPGGAATAVKPVAPQKLAVTPKPAASAPSAAVANASPKVAPAPAPAPAATLAPTAPAANPLITPLLAKP